MNRSAVRRFPAALVILAGLVVCATASAQQKFGPSHFDGDVGVQGQISAHSLKLTPKPADFVFRPGYALRPLAEVDAFIRQHGHLPEVPSEKEMLQHGVAVETLNGLYLQKIEELTLYLIDQQRELAAMRRQLAQLQATVPATPSAAAATTR